MPPLLGGDGGSSCFASAAPFSSLSSVFSCVKSGSLPHRNLWSAHAGAAGRPPTLKGATILFFRGFSVPRRRRLVALGVCGGLALPPAALIRAPAKLCFSSDAARFSASRRQQRQPDVQWSSCTSRFAREVPR